MKKIYPNLLLLSVMVAGSMTGCKNDSTSPPVDGNIQFTNASADYYGDYYQKGTGLFVVTLQGPSDRVELAIFSSLPEDGQAIEIDTGEYNPGNVEEGKQKTYIPDSDEKYSTNYYKKTDGNWSSPRPVVSGDFSITRSGENYIFDIRIRTNGGDEIKGSYSGSVNITDRRTPNLMVFENFYGTYMGDPYKLGSDMVRLMFYNGEYVDDEFVGSFEALEIYCYMNKSNYDEFETEVGEYKFVHIGEGVQGTFFGELDYAQGWWTRYQKFELNSDQESSSVNFAVLIADGEFIISPSGNGYTVDFDMAGYVYDFEEDVTTDEVYEISARYEGRMDREMYSDSSPDPLDKYNFMTLYYTYSPDKASLSLELYNMQTGREDLMYINLFNEATEGLNHITLFIEEGTYPINNSGDIGTASIGTGQYPSAGGTYFVDDRYGNPPSVGLATGGEVVVSRDGKNYTIELRADFKDWKTGQKIVMEEKYHFEGPISVGYYFSDDPLEYDDMGLVNAMIVYNEKWQISSEYMDLARITLNMWDADESTSARITFYVDYLEADERAYIPDGTYTIHDEPEMNGIRAGDYYLGDLRYTYLTRSTDGYIILHSYYTDGTMTVRRIQGDEYEISWDFTGKDERSRGKECTFKGTYRGTLTEVLETRRD